MFLPTCGMPEYNNNTSIQCHNLNIYTHTLVFSIFGNITQFVHRDESFTHYCKLDLVNHCMVNIVKEDL